MLSRLFFFFNDTATTEIYTLSLHDALPISMSMRVNNQERQAHTIFGWQERKDSFRQRHFAWIRHRTDRKSTRLNSSHLVISYAVFCLKKKTNVMPPSTSPRHERTPFRCTAT